ncbi:DUF4179 domain-containing protein [Lysinibacillus xylanilyticus]|uniref:DUF4179 domain-containing protein n=1 Tax=Lysinibacillus xylanilyticus TaxID=582475 RepID=UPI002B240D54|nr:DUF4179 domain-containing protein [Lysinibacillus xylanilyticus]MEB2280264.1 DUF4179 domain-containing protein [Lysinibacillus xylanilyticus]
MSKENNNQSIDRIDIPLQQLMAREQAAMRAAKKKKRNIRIIKPLLVACGLCIALLGAGFFSPTIATALANVPFIGVIYAEFGDIAAEKIEQNHLMTKIGKEDKHAGLTMAVEEAVYDGNRLLVTVAYTGQNGVSLKEEVVGTNKLTVNGEPIDVAMGSTGQKDIDKNTIIEHHELTLSNADIYGDNIEVALDGSDLFGYKGNWHVDFTLEKLKEKVVKIHPNVIASTSNGLYKLNVGQVSFTPLSTRIDVLVDYPNELDRNDKWPFFEFEVTDSEGELYDGENIQMGATKDNGHHIIIVLPPMENMPKSFTLKPGKTNERGYWEEMKELEIVVPLEP